MVLEHLQEKMNFPNSAPRVQKMNSEETCVFDNRTHACPDNEHDRVQNLNPNKTNINKPNMSKTNPILSINLTPEDAIDEMEGYSEIIVEYVINCLGKNTTKVRNIKSYLLASLFNAGSTISSYYRAEVNHDMPQFAG